MCMCVGGGDEPDITLPMLFGDNSLSDDSHFVENTTGPSNIPSGDSDSDSDEELRPDTEIPSEPRTTRVGKKIQLPARFRD